MNSAITSFCFYQMKPAETIRAPETSRKKKIKSELSSKWEKDGPVYF